MIVHVPALTIRVRVADPQARASRCREIINRGVLDTGAAMSMMPMWAAHELHLDLDGESKRLMASASEWTDVYQTTVGLDIIYNEKWIEVGNIDMVVPDTELSSDPVNRQPFLLGRGDFFKKFQMFIDESKKEVWLRKRDD